MKKLILLFLLLITASTQAAEWRGQRYPYEFLFGSGTPESSVTANVSALFARSDGASGSAVYMKVSGTGNTGWVAIAGLAENSFLGQQRIGQDVNMESAGSNAQVVIHSAATLNKRMVLGYNVGGNGGGFIQALNQTVAYTDLYLQPFGGVVLIGNSGANDGTAATLQVTGDSNLTSGNFTIRTVGKGLKIKEGTNATMGVATLASGTATIATTAIATGDRVILTRQGKGSSTAIGSLELGTVTAATSFVVNALKADATVETGDLSVVHWLIIKPAP